MQTKFIRLGNCTINLNAISHISWDCTAQVIDGTRFSLIRLYLGTTTGSADNFGMDWLEFGTDSPEGKALVRYFNNPDYVTDLMPNDEIEQ